MRFGTWNLRRPYGPGGALRTVSREIGRYKLDLVGVQEVSWDKRGTVRAGNYNFFMEEEKKIMNWRQIFFVRHRIVSAVKSLEFVSDRISYVVLRAHWCNVIVWNVQPPSGEKRDDSKVNVIRN
jgi:hypothetical protein